MDLSPTALTVIGLLLAAWTAGAAVVVLRANAKARRLKNVQTAFKRMQRMLDVAPAIPMLVRVDGRIEAPERLARWLGLDAVPTFLSELNGPEGQGLSPQQVEDLSANVRLTQKSAATFQQVVTPPGSQRSLMLHGALADPQVSPGGAALVWVFDFSESESELGKLRGVAARAERDFAALSSLIEAVPVPMWFRGKDAWLQLVNQAYVEAVGAADAANVVQKQIELLEPEAGQSPVELARRTLASQAKSERVVSATIHGERRSLRVADLPMGTEGVAGYAIDIWNPGVTMASG